MSILTTTQLWCIFAQITTLTLSGIIASLVGKNKLNCFDASCAGVWLHSEIGKKSGIGLIAEDLLKELKPVLKKLYGKFIKQRNRKKS